MEDLLDAVASLRATRRFAPRPVAPQDVDRILEAARWTGSARNRQPWRLVVVDEPSRLDELSRLGAYAQFVRGAPLALLIAIDREAVADRGVEGAARPTGQWLAAGWLIYYPDGPVPAYDPDGARRLLAGRADAKSTDLAMLSVALRKLRNLA